MKIQVATIAFFCLMILSLISSFRYDPPVIGDKSCPSEEEVAELFAKFTLAKTTLEQCQKPDLVVDSLLLSLKESVENCQATLKKYLQEFNELSEKKGIYTYNDCLEKYKKCEKKIQAILKEEQLK